MCAIRPIKAFVRPFRSIGRPFAHTPPHHTHSTYCRKLIPAGARKGFKPSGGTPLLPTTTGNGGNGNGNGKGRSSD